METTYIEKARAIIASVVGMNPCEWQKIVHAVDREFELEKAKHSTTFKQQNAINAMQQIRYEN